MSATLPPLHDEARPLDHAFARWVRRESGSEPLARAAFAVSRVEGEGHACALLEAEPELADDIAAIRAHAWVGDGTQPTPFVLDAAGRFYTWRNWRHETRLAEALRERAGDGGATIPDAAIAADVAALFGDEDAHATRWQRAAVAAAPGTRLLVLTGGPGTGKTTTALRLLLTLLHHAGASGLPARASVALAAPTGKAAQRLAQAIAAGKQRLAARLAPDSPLRALLDRIPHAEAGTLHRLLGYRPGENTFARGPHDPLAADIVLVDEASMVDLALMRTLLDALRPEAVLVLLGDPGQLAAVEAGSVLSDVVASAQENAFPPTLARRLDAVLDVPAPRVERALPLSGRVLALHHGWRAGGALAAALESLRAGDADALVERIAAPDADGVRLQPSDTAAALRTRVTQWIDTQADTYAALFAPRAEPAATLAVLRRVQVLCALRNGPFGAEGVNALFARELAARFGFDATQRWHHGRPVLIVRNDYARELYNGDVGIALEGPDGLRVWFEVGRRDGSVGLRSVSPRALPEHESAWAITIHRSQGSEYGAVAVVLPPDPAHRLLSRELLYTALSRATRHAEIWSSAAAVAAAARRPIQRSGGLRARLA